MALMIQFKLACLSQRLGSVIFGLCLKFTTAIRAGDKSDFINTSDPAIPFHFLILKKRWIDNEDTRAWMAGTGQPWNFPAFNHPAISQTTFSRVSSPRNGSGP